MFFDGFVSFLLMESTFSFLGFVGFLRLVDHMATFLLPCILCVMMPRVFRFQALELLKDGKEAGAMQCGRDIPRDRSNIGTDLVKPMVNQW